MSGAEISYHSIIGRPDLAFNNTLKLGRYLGCTQPAAIKIWNCILTRSTNDIIQALQTVPVRSIDLLISCIMDLIKLTTLDIMYTLFDLLICNTVHIAIDAEDFI